MFSWNFAGSSFAGSPSYLAQAGLPLPLVVGKLWLLSVLGAPVGIRSRRIVEMSSIAGPAPAGRRPAGSSRFLMRALNPHLQGPWARESLRQIDPD
eukprot:2099020-Alexandrium_andersonii.AAC.1